MLKGMSVRGALSTMPAEDVLDWVARRKLSGPISFERRGLVRSIVVENGVIVYASSNRRDEQLGVILVRSGLVAERKLADSLETRAETGVQLGKMSHETGGGRVFAHGQRPHAAEQFVIRKALDGLQFVRCIE